MNCFLSKLSFGHCKLGSQMRSFRLDFFWYYIHVQFYLFSMKAVWFSMWNACEMLWAFCCYWCLASKMILFLGESLCDGSSRYCFGEAFLCTPSAQVWQMGKSSMSCVCVCVYICVRVCVHVLMHAFWFVEWSLISGNLHTAFYKELITTGCYRMDHRTIIVLCCFWPMSSRFFFKLYI